MSACRVFQFHLDLFKESGRKERHMGSLCIIHCCILVEMVMGSSGMRLPSENSNVERVGENVADRPAVKRISAGSADARVIEKACNFRAGASS